MKNHRNKNSRRASFVYLDYAATTPVDTEVLKKMAPYFAARFANPASLHAPGREAKVALEQARSSLALILGAEPHEIVFTSSATESNNLALKGVARAYREHGKHIVVSAIEHACVLEAARALEREGFALTVVPVDRSGRVSAEAVAAVVRSDTILVSVMHANNEIGTMQPIKEIARLVQKERARREPAALDRQSRTTRDRSLVTRNWLTPPFFHSDAVQTFGRLPVRVRELGVDLLTCSSHKIYGPKGAALLYVRGGIKIEPLLHGGGHEDGRRSSTVNVPAIVGFAEAAAIAERARERESRRVLELSNRLIQLMRQVVPDVVFNGEMEMRVPHILNARIPGVSGEALLFALEERGFAVSVASGCSALKLTPSHVLLACGLSKEQTFESIRISLGRGTRASDIQKFVKAFAASVEKARALSSRQ
ncbi:MAG: cysteine desulfurase family protein [Patescibacteria group bacterium]|nr:cysteine desulfurase family protein [Patescibacteria group bacterium]